MSEIPNSSASSLSDSKNNEQVQDDISKIPPPLSKPSKRTVISSKAGTGIKGHLFESKLLALFMVRAIRAGYQFELATNNEEIGGKFDDLIFRYEVQDDATKSKHWRYRFLQAKHKVDNTAMQIEASNLLSKSNDEDKKDYSLLKYIESYCKIKARGDDIHDCIICTTIDFDYNNMDGIQLKPFDISKEEILKFHANSIGSSNGKSPTIYKLELPENDRKKLLESSDIRKLAELLSTCATKSHSPNKDIFKTYHVALVKEKVIDLGDNSTKSQTMKLHQDFVKGEENLSPGAKDLRQLLINSNNQQDLAKWKFQRPGFFQKLDDAHTMLPRCITDDDVTNFCDKLVFVVNSPSEEELDAIIRNDISKYYHQNDADDQSRRVSNEVLNWFKSIKDEKSQWLSSINGKKILLDGVTKQSCVYRNQLLEELGFNQNAIGHMATRLKNMMDSPTDKVIKFSTLSPRWTAAKIISAIETWPKYKTCDENGYWVTSIISLLNEETRQSWKNRLDLTKNHFFLIVNDDKYSESDYKDVVTVIPNDGSNKMILIGTGHGAQDEINFADLNDTSKKTLLSKKISFQGQEITVENLIPAMANDIIDSSSVRELMGQNHLVIPSFDSSRFEQILYIKREITCPFQNPLLDEDLIANQHLSLLINELQGECKIKQNGKLQWLVQDDEKKNKAWEKIKTILENTNSSQVSENEIMNIRNHSRVIIMGVAGTGKSTMLSKCYTKFKMEKPDCWVIRLDLLDQINALYTLKSSTNRLNQEKVFEFLISLPTIGIGHSPFARSLLKHRLKTGDRIIIMLDGFDEIGDVCQKEVIQLVKNLQESVPVYITTRPHMADSLQIELSQLGYSLVKFDEEKQIDYLTSFWKKSITSDEKNSTEDIKTCLQNFAKVLINKVSDTLNDQEKDFIGIPLQCRILAECFQSKIHDIMNSSCTENNETNFANLLDGQNFNLCSLYRLSMQTKRQIFCQDKIKLIGKQNDSVDYTIQMTVLQIESHLTKLAIETIFQNQEHVNILWPSTAPETFRYLSENKLQQEKINLIDDLSVKFGLLDKSTNQFRFLHQTFAEYLVANYIYKEFLSDEKGQNKLLENESVRDLIAKELPQKTYNGVKVFLDSMFKEMRESSRKQQANTPMERLANFFSENVLFKHFSQNTNIVHFFFDCFDEVFLPSRIRDMISFFPFFSFHLNGRMFQRLLTYFKDANNEELTKMFGRLWNDYSFLTSQRTNQMTITNVIFLLDFWKLHWTTSLRQNSDNQRTMIRLIEIIFHDATNQHLQSLFEFLSIIYSRDLSCTAYIVKEAITSYYRNDWKTGSIAKTLDLLHNLTIVSNQQQNQEEIDPMNEISCLVLGHEPETFIEFYKKFGPQNFDEDTTDNIDLTVSDNWGMTRLHHAALHGDTQAVDNILKNCTKKLATISYDPIAWEEAIRIIEIMIHATPGDWPLLHIGFITCCNNESMCHNMLKFLKNILTNSKGIAALQPHLQQQLYFILIQNQYLWDLMNDSGENVRKFGILNRCWMDFGRGVYFTPKNEFLRRALEYAIYYNKENIFQGILKSVKILLGKEAVVRLLQIKIFENRKSKTKYRRHRNSLITVFLAVSEIGWFNKAIVDIIEDDERNIAYLNNLIFEEDNILALEYVEDVIIQRLNETSGFQQYFDCLLEKDFVWAFNPSVPIIRVISALDEIQRSQLIETIVNKLTSENIYIMSLEFLKQTPKLFTTSDVKKLLFHKIDNNPVFIQGLIWNRIKNRKKSIGYKSFNPSCDNEVDEILDCLPSEIQMEFCQIFKQQESQIIEELFFDEKRLENCTDRNWLPILQFYLDYGTDDQLSKFIYVLTTPRNKNNGQKSSLWDFILGNDTTTIYGITVLMKDLVNKLGENAVKDLLLQDNGSGVLTLYPSLIKIASEDHFQDIYAHLSKEIKDEIQCRVLSTPGVIDQMLDENKSSHKVIQINHLTFKIIPITEHWIRFYLGINSKGLATKDVEGFYILSTYFVKTFHADTLQRFIELITKTERIDNSTRYSIWTDYIDQICQLKNTQPSSADETIRTFVKHIKEIPNDGISLLYELVTHDVDGMGYDVAVRAASSGNIQIFEALISQLEEYQHFEIRLKTFGRLAVVTNVWKINGPEFLIGFYLTEPYDSQSKSKIAIGFNFLVRYFLEVLDKEQLRQFIELILSVNAFDFCHTVWGDYVCQVFSSNHIDETSIQTIEILLNRVANYLGDAAVKDLVCHQDADGIIIRRITSHKYGSETFYNMLNHLTDEDEEEILRIIDNEHKPTDLFCTEFPTEELQ